MSFTARALSLRLGRTPILHAVDFTANAGQVTAIVGPNGSGKTSLLRALCGDVAYHGKIAINGHPVGSLKGWQLAAMRAVLPQSASLAFPFTVAEVVRLGLISGDAAQRSHLSEDALRAVGLGGYGARHYQDLSGGEQSRVQLARVLTQVWEPVQDGTPRWLLLDEPVASLDIGHQLRVIRLLRDYAARGGGVIAVMHDLNLTAMFADAVAVVHEGRIAASGTVGQVLTGPVLSQAYGCALHVNRAPDAGETWILPHVARLWQAAE